MPTLSALRKGRGMSYSIDSTTWQSPNYDKTASGAPIEHAPEGMTLHSDEGTRGSSLPWLCNPKSGVSAQLYVCRPDATGHVDIYQLVKDTYRAWHAGTSSYDGLTDWNKTIGVEAEHKQGQDWPKEQIAALTWLFQMKIATYKLPRSRIAMHRTVATPPGRKIDPTNWSDADFKLWADALYKPGAGIYHVNHTQVIFEAPAPDARIALNGTAMLWADTEADIDEVAHGGWAHLRNHVGFVPVGVLTRVS